MPETRDLDGEQGVAGDHAPPWGPPLDYKPTTGVLSRRAARLFGERDFIVTDEKRASYLDIELASRNFARRLLAAGFGKGARIAAQFPYGPEWVIIWLGVTRIGGLFSPMSTAYKPPELAKALRIGDIQLLVTPATFMGTDRLTFLKTAVAELDGQTDPSLFLRSHPYLREIWLTSAAEDAPFAKHVGLDGTFDHPRIDEAFLEEVESEVVPADLMFTIYTSGTSSEPKCVVHTHGSALRHTAWLAQLLRYQASDRVFAGMPFFWVGGSCNAILPLMTVGGAVLCVEKFEPGRVLDLLEREGATRLIGWPGVTGPLLAHPSLPDRKIPVLEDPDWTPATGVTRTSGLGMSETCGQHTALRVEERALPEAQGSLGRSAPFMEHKIVDPDTLEELEEGEEGVILIRGYALMDGFYKKERRDIFLPDGFYNTGDRGRFSDGFLFFKGRNTEMIKTRGSNVAPAEVEAELRSFPGLSSAYVFGNPDGLGDETVVAVVTLEPGVETTAADMQDHLRERIANYKVPRQIRILHKDEIPWLATGKPDLRALRRFFDSSPKTAAREEGQS